MRALTGKEERIPGSGTQLVKKPDSFRFRTVRKKRCRRQVGWKKNNKKPNSVLLYNMCRCFPEVSVYSWPPACLPSGFKHRVVSIRGASLAAPQLNSDQFPSSRWRSVTLTPSSFQQQQQWVRLEVRYLLQRLSASGSHTSGKLMTFYLERRRQRREDTLHRFVPVWSALWSHSIWSLRSNESGNESGNILINNFVRSLNHKIIERLSTSSQKDKTTTTNIIILMVNKQLVKLLLRQCC